MESDSATNPEDELKDCAIRRKEFFSTNFHDFTDGERCARFEIERRRITRVKQIKTKRIKAVIKRKFDL